MEEGERDHLEQPDGDGLALEPETIGEALYLLRRRTNLAREELARRAQVMPATYSRYENGTTRAGAYDVAQLNRIISVLAVELDKAPATIWTTILKVLDRRDRAFFQTAAETGAFNVKRGKA